MADDRPTVRVVYPGGRSPREQALWQARAWLDREAQANTPAPSEIYLIVSRLVAVLQEDR